MMTAVATQLIQEVCYYSQNMGVAFKADDPVAENQALIEFLEDLDPDHINKADGMVSFVIHTNRLGHFLHLMYCSVESDQKIRVDMDGIFPFDGPDEQNVIRRFNSQLMTISQVPA